jgi:hypothetical protein
VVSFWQSVDGVRLEIGARGVAVKDCETGVEVVCGVAERLGELVS